MNCLAIETRDGIVVVDCGVTFPNEPNGVDVIHPDFSYLWDRRDEIKAILVTHGHEDHIGALPYLLRMISAPVYAPAYARVLIEHRLEEHPDVPPMELHTITPGRTVELGAIKVEPLRVTHSIPDATAFCIETPGARIIHTGDFKLEDDPLDGQATDEKRFAALGKDGVDLLLSDSTNVDVPTRGATERSVGSALKHLVGQQEGRVVVGLFASNVFRMQSIVDAALSNGRQICLLGRSVQTHSKAASMLGKLRLPSDMLVSPEFAMRLPPSRVLAIATGTQAEPISALSRLARHEHNMFRLESGDSVIFSSRTIPGNERLVMALICSLERNGVNVHFSGTDSNIHVSGHAARDEQTRMLQLVNPRGFIPLHGTFHHLKQHANLARSFGVERTMVIENGETARWSNGDLRGDGGVPHGRVYVDQGMSIPKRILEERAEMGDAGTVMARVIVDKYGLLTGTPIVSTRGVLLDRAASALEKQAQEAIEDALKHAKGGRASLSPEESRDAAARALKRVYRSGHRRPLVMVQLLTATGTVID
jgi:ribonuclease J